MGYGLLANPDNFSLEMEVEWTFSGNSLIWVVLLLNESAECLNLFCDSKYVFLGLCLSYIKYSCTCSYHS